MTFPQKKSKDFKRAKKEKRGVGQGAQDAKGSLAVKVTLNQKMGVGGIAAVTTNPPPVWPATSRVPCVLRGEEGAPCSASSTTCSYLS